ncbi:MULTISPECIES: hypothetical protein [Xanthomonas]|uniref:hypothetical protein n=1 Tax=Xanthomonas TaxID=338 RepID=UPI0002D585B0|nr:MULTISPECIES: hypothetical protein [Xanthomonas]MBB6368514.1 hypothetical protein [Xanthomonas sp. F10]MCI2245751.1 hypothetical protein [Xanthomonas indica]UYC12192.1 hypothetical protein NUG21_00095 [Xanthomonas sp. CFBP 8445]
MNQTLVVLFFFATAPVALMPTVIALFTRHRWRKRIVLINLALWTLLFFAARSFTLSNSSRFELPTLLALAMWLVLLGIAIRGNPAPAAKR